MLKRFRLRGAVVSGLGAAACSLASLTAQGDPQPTCKMCPASYISHDELQAYLKRAIANNIVDQKRRPADANNVKMLSGPGNGAASIRNGVAHQLKAGDVIVIPAGTGHWFTKIDDHITYLMVRIDPDKVTPLRDEAASKSYLSTP